MNASAPIRPIPASDSTYKTNAPYPDDETECDCMDHEADILTGTTTCHHCGNRWVQTAEEIERERQHQIEYDRMCEQWDREQRSVLHRARRLFSRIASWFRRSQDLDEIPF